MALAIFEAVDDGGQLVSRVRQFVAEEVRRLGRPELVDDAVLVVSELAANAMLHAGGIAGVRLTERGDAVRIEVHDHTRVPPVMARQSVDAMTGRGLRLVASLASQWGAEPTESGKLVWAELSPLHTHTAAMSVDEVIAMWDDGAAVDAAVPVTRYHVSLGDVPTPLLLSAKAHVDNLVREFTLAARGAETKVSGELPPHLAGLIETVATRFAEPRQSIKRQALVAAAEGRSHVRLELDLPASAADAGEEYLRALDEADSYCHAARLLTIETSPRHRLFRQWYVGELVSQLRAASAGIVAPPTQSFEDRLLNEFDAAATAQAMSKRVTRLYELSAALSSAASQEAVAAAVLEQGVAALGASGGGVLLSTEANRLSVPGTVGYDEPTVDRLRDESPDAELPAAVALRTGQPVWIESREERDRRFPELRDLESNTLSMCAVPLVIGDRCQGALWFSFLRSRLFDEDERRFVLALAAQTAQAFARTELNEQRLEFSRRLQLSLLPRRFTPPPHIELAGVYRSLGDGTELGGDIYDMWAMPDGRWGVTIADASGTGPEAAALTAMVRFSLRALATAEAVPVAVVDNLNRALLGAEVGGFEGERFCTALFGVITPGPTSTVTLAGGGHPSPMVRRADGTIEEIAVGGSLLGVLDEVTFASAEITLRDGDALVLYTDGVIEARRHGTMFGVEGVRAAIAGAPLGADPLARAIEQAVLDHTDGVVSDDLAVLVIRSAVSDE
ncbi:MAG TPA: SpoIIE family protein phosphatase [Acidimicrobiales bacterium]|nr:SpoIIE family protein phosphatase [Acidimicrobiales bacterium]